MPASPGDMRQLLQKALWPKDTGVMSKLRKSWRPGCDMPAAMVTISETRSRSSHDLADLQLH